MNGVFGGRLRGGKGVEARGVQMLCDSAKLDRSLSLKCFLWIQVTWTL